MQNTTSLLSSDLLKLPVVLTPRAWQEAVHIEHPHDAAVISSRLGDVVLRPTENCICSPIAPKSISASIDCCLPATTLIESGWT